MPGFPHFMKHPRNRIATSSQYTSGVEGYVFDGPAGVSSYSLVRLIDDVAAIVRGFGKQKVCLVGHDVGGGLA
jgi:hypothetical protein